MADEQRGREDIKVARKPKLRDAGGGGIGRRKVRSHRRILIALAILLIVAGVITLAFFIVLGTDFFPSMRYFEKISCKEESPTSMHINACLTSKCTFDPSTCGEDCPFGYATDESGCEENCQCASEGLFEGDISFTEENLPQLSVLYGYSKLESDFNVFSGSATTGALWNDSPKNGRHTINFMMSSVTSKAKVAIKEAIKRFKEQTCIDFVERTTEKKYFRFTSGHGCQSMVGRYKINGQPLSIGKGCEIPGTAQHELLHLLGFFHEHSRPDRDSYLIVVEDNILKGKASNFKKRLRSSVLSLDSEYDMTSIMHYPGNAFTRNGEPTILRRKDRGEVTYQRTAFTKEDLYEVNVLYNCFKNQDTAEWSLWSQWSSCDETCGLGERSRFRKCLKRGQLVSGCEGEKFQKFICHAPRCPSLQGIWNNWGGYSDCSGDCEGGFQWRKRSCIPHGECEGGSYQGQTCIKEDCVKSNWGMWTSWGSCSAECGGGSMTRRRQCKSDDGTIAITCDSGETSGTEAQERECNTLQCGSEQCNVGVCNNYDSMFPGPAMYQSKVTSITWTSVMCDPSAMNSWLFGDFNGDGQADVLCSDGSGQFKLGHTSPSGSALNVAWSGTLVGCDYAEKLIGDFNGDGNDDILCRSVQNKRLAIKLTTEDGRFTDKYLDAGNFCTESTSRLVVIYASGNKKADLACHFSTKTIEIRLNE